jgi:hypothetical protein
MTPIIPIKGTPSGALRGLSASLPFRVNLSTSMPVGSTVIRSSEIFKSEINRRTVALLVVIM